MINLYKQNEGFNSSSFKGKVIDGIEQIPNEIKDDLIQVEDGVYCDLIDHKLMWKDGELVQNSNYGAYNDELTKARARKQKEKRINELKQLLADSDYRAIKYAEGFYTEAEYKTYKQERQAYRDEINRLESELK